MFIEDKSQGDQLTSSEFNQIPSELQSVISRSGQSPTNATTDQVNKALMDYAAYGAYYTQINFTPPNIYILQGASNRQELVSWKVGVRIRFTLTNQSSSGTVNIRFDPAGSNPAPANTFLEDTDGAQIRSGRVPINQILEAEYISSNRLRLTRNPFQTTDKITFQSITATGAGMYMPPLGVTYVIVDLIGGGGGGGSSSNVAQQCGGGGAGGNTIRIFQDMRAKASVNYVVGAGGAGGVAAGAGNAGSQGGNTTWDGVYQTGNAGGGHVGGANSIGNGIPDTIVASGTAPSLYQSGGFGFPGFTGVLMSGAGGGSYLGGGGPGRNSVGTPILMQNGWGSGAGGGVSNSATVQAGAAGRQGAIFITEYYF